MAATLSFTACSSEDDLPQEPTAPQQPTETATKIHVSVGAGIDPTATRSTVDYTNGTRTLQFTAGDKLYVYGTHGDKGIETSGIEYYPNYIVGYLGLDTESFDSSNPTNATFTGDLAVYQWINEVGHKEEEQEWVEEQGHYEYGGDVLVGYDDDGNGIYEPGNDIWVVDEEGHYQIAGERWEVDVPGHYEQVSYSSIFSTDDPLGECNNVSGTLIHENTMENRDYSINESDQHVEYSCIYAASVEELMTKALEVKGDYNAGTKSFTLANYSVQPILNCSISGLTADATYKVEYLFGPTETMEYSTTLASASSPMTATGGTLSFAFIPTIANYFHGIRLTNTADANDTYTVNIGQKSFASKVYNLSRIWDGYSMQKRIVDLSKISGNYTAQDGDILTGDFNRNVTITDGATVTLSDVTLESSAIFCAGSATINLLGNNSVSNSDAICINAGTLTIQGSGSLTAQGGDNRPGIGGGSSSANVVIKSGTITASGGEGAAGIGSYSNASFGTITIEGGNIQAWGGDNGAGIGSGMESSCGNITITGGMVTVWGGRDAAGIGSGFQSSCGNITIGGSAVIGAYRGGDNAECIGIGQGGDCGSVTVDSNMIDTGEGSGFRTIEPMP